MRLSQVVIGLSLLAAGCANMVSKTVTPCATGKAVQIYSKSAESQELSEDDPLRSKLEAWLAKRRVTHDDYKSYAPDVVVSGETFSINLLEDRVIFNIFNPTFSVTSAQSSWKSTKEDRELRRDVLEWLRSHPQSKASEQSSSNDGANN